MARTTLDFSSTFQRPHPTAIIMPSSSFPFSLTIHNHHHYPLKAPTPSFIRNIIITIHQPFAHDHLHHHKHHSPQGQEQAQEEAEDEYDKDKGGGEARSLMFMRKPYFRIIASATYIY